MTVTADGHARRRQATRERLYDAAVELFILSGYAATTMEAIAEHAGTSRRTAFNHFPTKPSFTLEWTRRRRERAGQRAALDPDPTVTGRLRAFYHELAVLTAETPLETEAMLLGWFTVGGPARHRQPLPEAVATWLQETGANNALRTDSFRAAELLSDVYLGALCRWLNEGRATDVVKEIDSAIELALSGLAL